MKLFLTLTTCFIGFFLQAQVTIDVQSQLKTITCNELVIKEGTTIDAALAKFGKDVRIEKTGGVERVFVYDQLGISFHVKADGSKKVEAVSVAFQPDTSRHDRKVAKNPYTGMLKADGYVITGTASVESITANTKIQGLSCAMYLLCMSDPKAKGIKVIMSYLTNEKKQISEIGFIL